MEQLFGPPINNLEKFLYKQNKDNKLFQIIQNEEIFVSVCWHDGPSYEYIITLAEIIPTGYKYSPEIESLRKTPENNTVSPRRTCQYANQLESEATTEHMYPFVEKGEKIVIKDVSLFAIKEFLLKNFVIISINNISENESVSTISKK
jgi:hypothetical protein